ncbi:MAG TPA: glycosyltransferase family 2 protein [Syntrophales bacterium]|nr:glycosyltransferase family 2 protein [Syntrophales bacterium]
MKKISDQYPARVIVVNWNGKHFLDDCLTALEKQTYPNFEVTLVDNGSADGSVAFVRNRFPRVHIIDLPENLGFSGANNRAMTHALGIGAQYIALLNNDTKVDERWLEHMVRVMESEKNIGICASKMLRMDTPHILDSTGHTFKWGRIFERGHGEVDAHQYDAQLSIVGACAGACLYRGEMLKEIGLFEESYGSYYEDAELSWRAYNRGWRARFVPESIVLHHRGGTTKSDPQFEKEMKIRYAMNVVETVKKHATLSQKLTVSLTCLILTPVRALQKRLGSNDMGGRLYWEQLRKLWSRKAQGI